MESTDPIDEKIVSKVTPMMVVVDDETSHPPRSPPRIFSSNAQAQIAMAKKMSAQRSMTAERGTPKASA